VLRESHRNNTQKIGIYGILIISPWLSPTLHFLITFLSSTWWKMARRKIHLRIIIKFIYRKNFLPLQHKTFNTSLTYSMCCWLQERCRYDMVDFHCVIFRARVCIWLPSSPQDSMPKWSKVSNKLKAHCCSRNKSLCREYKWLFIPHTQILQWML
jgi:hypothetical protein